MEFNLLPDLVILKILKYLCSYKRDLANFGSANKYLNSTVNANLHLIYYEHLELDNKVIRPIKQDRPILSMVMTCHMEKMTMTKYHIDLNR